ncbi:MAG: Na+/H+ antiporter NhaC [Flavobacteriales bacterium]|nr:Na+/H+ antiporter NhaC [Flavobacteriales bacterium]
MKQKKEIIIVFLPIFTLISILLFNVLYFENSLHGPNQIALMIAAILAALIAYRNNIKMNNLGLGIIESIKSSINAIIILIIIGGLTATWILSGVVPAMIYYGIELINPKFFLFTTCIICSIVSLATGSSWTTSATIGVALIGIGELISINTGLVAGAILSGAYFGDKMSPLSETTNLAPSVSGSDLISHIKHMTYTTVPTISITLFVFLCIGINSSQNIVPLFEVESLLDAIQSNFNIGIELFILPLLIIILVYNKFSAINTLLIGLITGALFACIFQTELIAQINSETHSNTLETISKTILFGTDINIDNQNIKSLLDKGGISSMLWIIFLVLSAMTFGGVMFAGGFLKKITSLMVSKSSSHRSIINSTVGSCIFINITTCDQYLAIVVPGRMFKEVYEEHGLCATNLSRTIEDSGTVTSVLVPWNTCSAYHSATLGLDPITFIPFCFFNIISPFMTLLYAYLNIKIKKVIK